MARFLGEYNCKLDAKGRVLLPAALKKQMPKEAGGEFVINRGFEQCLVMYPRNEWDMISEEINKLNPYVRKNRDFVRYFFRGATELSLDTSGRLLLPKRLLQYANINKELVFFAHTNKIEVWASEIYDGLLSNEPDEFSSLAENVMGNNHQSENDDG
jgi:MraZ protein